MIPLDDQVFRAGLGGGANFGIMSPVRRCGTTIVALCSGLTWFVRTAIGDRGQSISTYAAWFECTQENAYETCKFWRPGAPAVYECEDHEVSVTVENLYTTNGGRKLLGTLAVRSDHYTQSSLRPELMPSMLVLRFELQGAKYREPELMFVTNPTCHLDWPSNEHEYEIPVHAPYDATLRDGRHQFYLDLRYRQTERRRCFLLSSPPGELRFHTALTVWRAETPLRVTLISHLPSLQVHRGTRIATLYPIHGTEGDLYQANEHAAMRLVKGHDGPSEGPAHLYVGDLRLPRENFAFYDEI